MAAIIAASMLLITILPAFDVLLQLYIALRYVTLLRHITLYEILLMLSLISLCR